MSEVEVGEMRGKVLLFDHVKQTNMSKRMCVVDDQIMVPSVTS